MKETPPKDAIGRQKSRRCQMDPARAVALHHALAMPGQPPAAGDALPPFFHQLYFWDPRPPAELGRDGHTQIGDFVPDLGLPRRMWAGGRVLFHAPLRAGTHAQLTETIEAVERKEGRTGPLALATIRREVAQDGTLCVTEYQNLVFRAEHDADAPAPTPPVARRDEAECDEFAFSTSLLFRYSALTLNGHRIHYDQPYAQMVEGYPDLVVHGPLLAQILILKAQSALGPLSEFRFRSTAPLFVEEAAGLCRTGAELWVRGPDGRQIMRASARARD